MKLARPIIAAATLATCATVAAPAVAASGSASHTRVISSCSAATYKPHSYILSCADANTSITHATYSMWNKHSAEGKGTYVYNTCTPDCAAGTMKHHPVTFIVSRPRGASGARLFTRISVSYAGLTENFTLPTSTD